MGDYSGAELLTLQRSSIELTSGWHFKQTDNSDPHGWLPVEKVPSTVHQDLIDNQKYA
jgi:hypothetical protein